MNKVNRKLPRSLKSYRGARRNDVLRGEIKGVWPSSATPSDRPLRFYLNRSRRWRSAKSYVASRALSPFPDRPVR